MSTTLSVLRKVKIESLQGQRAFVNTRRNLEHCQLVSYYFLFPLNLPTFQITLCTSASTELFNCGVRVS